jgi:hypothetical protein
MNYYSAGGGGGGGPIGLDGGGVINGLGGTLGSGGRCGGTYRDYFDDCDGSLGKGGEGKLIGSGGGGGYYGGGGGWSNIFGPSFICIGGGGGNFI